MAIMISRRGLLRTSLQVTLAGTIATAGIAAAEGTSCPNATMDAGLASSLHYADASPDPGKSCSGCGFFTAGDGGCGSCQIFNSPVNAKGHCDSWAMKG